MKPRQNSTTVKANILVKFCEGAEGEGGQISPF